jgi:quercetin dioxygenase-like cupin family protein
VVEPRGGAANGDRLPARLMDIRKFGPGNRRADGPLGTQGVGSAVIHHDERALVTELAFSPYAMVAPHSNPNTALFVVISGGGYVQVGDERTRVNHGEAVLWPADVPHGAYTDGTEMRAIVIELPAENALVLAGEAARVLTEATGGATRPTEGGLAPRQKLRSEYDSSEGEPW